MLCNIFIKDVKCKSAFWHFNVALLDDNVFRDTFRAFWDGFKIQSLNMFLCSSGGT